ncbi:hypothetical protein PUN28_003047 [Cardiocondyla obscurior]|uniref:Uncharacterized protein n=1 Tax=Cardiocondyla obscurior TaxID=286306 RepID=A0AAW2GX97_9HYME
MISRCFTSRLIQLITVTNRTCSVREHSGGGIYPPGLTRVNAASIYQQGHVSVVDGGCSRAKKVPILLHDENRHRPTRTYFSLLYPPART